MGSFLKSMRPLFLFAAAALSLPAWGQAPNEKVASVANGTNEKASDEKSEISWTPRITTISAEGAMLTRVYFSDGKNRYALSTDPEIEVEPAGGGAKFTYKKVRSATFLLRAATPKLELPPEAKKIEDYRRAALALAPGGSGDFSQLEESVDSLNINGWRSYRLDFSYNFYGHRHRRSVTFLTLENGQQIVLDTAAEEADFAQAMARSDYLIRSWHRLRAPSAEPPQS